jgi:hypothetical protein
MQKAVIAIALLAAALFMAVSGTTNGLFLASLGRTPLEAMLYAATSIAADLAKLVLPVFIAWAWMRKRWWIVSSAIVVLAVLIAFSITSGIGFAALTRGSVIAERVAVDQRAAGLEKDLVGIELSRSALVGVRPASVVEEELRALLSDRSWALSAQCAEPKSTTQREFCGSQFRLRAVLATAKEAERLQAESLKLRAELAKLSAIGQGGAPDPQLAAIADLLRADPQTVRLGLVVGLAFVLELGAVALILIAASMQHEMLRRQDTANVVAEPAKLKQQEASVPLPAKARQWVKRQEAMKARANGKEAEDVHP